jgi:hypothetical protein
MHLCPVTSEKKGVYNSFRIVCFYISISNTVLSKYMYIHCIWTGCSGVIPPNPCLYQYFIKKYHFWFMPSLSGKNQGLKQGPGASCITIKHKTFGRSTGFITFITLRSVLVPTQPPIKWVPVLYSVC